MRILPSASASALLALCLSMPVAESRAEGWLGADRGKLLLTAGFSTLEGAGGGALAPMALITGYGTSDGWGANVHASGLRLDDLDVISLGLSVGVLDRFELSGARMTARFTDTPLDGLRTELDVLGIKLRVLGDAVYGQDSWLPQVAIGAQFKRNRGITDAPAPFDTVTSVLQLGALETDEVDFFLAATKLSLSRGLLVNVALRSTRANQFGLLGFSGDRDTKRAIEIEASAGYLLSRTLIIGGEYRTRSGHLNIDHEQDAWDAFLAWAPSRGISLVLGYASIGPVLASLTRTSRQQSGAYLSIQTGF